MLVISYIGSPIVLTEVNKIYTLLLSIYLNFLTINMSGRKFTGFIWKRKNLPLYDCKSGFSFTVNNEMNENYHFRDI